MSSVRTSLTTALVATVLTVALSACGPRPDPVHKEQILAMGTMVNITLWGVDNDVAQKAFTAANQDFNYMQTAYHPWKPGPMGRTNQLLALDAWFSANPSVLPLIKRAKALYHASDGLFNPAIGRLIGLWGFHSDTLPKGPPPSKAAIERLVAQHPTMDDIQIKGIRVRSTNPAVQLDTGGFAKGYAVDRVIDHLRRLGVSNAIVDAGGDLRAIGSHGGEPWHIGIRDPSAPGILAEVDVKGDESVFTSGVYERFYMYKGKRYHHIIDPRTGYPARGTTSATVIGSDGATSDAAATALLIAGPKLWHRVAESMGIKYAMLVASDGTVYMNPAMAKRMHFEHKPPKVVLSAPL
ncbi:MAG: FAD:protein FMN transferase [Gammaproteobacteria bacterium]